jgi:hypothetical protein
MAIRLKSQWHAEDGERSLNEIGGALAFNIWRLAVDKAVNLHSEHFAYQDDAQRLSVIDEYAIFLALVVERLVHPKLSDEQRRELVTAMVLKLADHVDDNSRSMLGQADYRTPFVEKFNRRAEEYAELGFDDEGPSYPFYRHLGYEIQQAMGLEQINRWVIDQVMDLDAPDIYNQIKRVTRNLFY